MKGEDETTAVEPVAPAVRRHFDSLEKLVDRINSALNRAGFVAAIQMDAAIDELAAQRDAAVRRKLDDKERAALAKLRDSIVAFGGDDADVISTGLGKILSLEEPGQRCARCHRAAPNFDGCAACNPVKLGERLRAALAERELMIRQLAVARSGTAATAGLDAAEIAAKVMTIVMARTAEGRTLSSGRWLR